MGCGGGKTEVSEEG